MECNRGMVYLVKEMETSENISNFSNLENLIILKKKKVGLSILIILI